ncbi:TetR/AcrR family transcriptional regulator [Streptomyces fagopyri]|uniref:TetR/AcrR family transcriptional regulator n=1 Tax=Streptomyces fagopyri TaxID=2662397 RepID=UPI0033F3FB02
MGTTAPEPSRRVRADARRSIDALVEAARDVFATQGVDAPVREITKKAGVGLATFYRHFPDRSDLVSAVFRHEVDACADAAVVMAATYEPFDALARWLRRFTDFIGTKRGLATALHSGNPAYEPLPAYFQQRFEPALTSLLVTATAAGDIRGDVEATELLSAVARLCSPADADRTRDDRMISLLLDGLRYGASARPEGH